MVIVVLLYPWDKVIGQRALLNRFKDAYSMLGM